MQGIPQGQSPQGGSQKPSLSWQSPSASKPAAAQEKKSSAPKNEAKVSVPANNMTTYAGIFVAGLIVGALLGWGVLEGRNTNSTASATDAAAAAADSDTGITLPGSGPLQGLAIPAGQKAGVSVSVSDIRVAKPTWVIIYDNAGGLPGKALGAQLFFPVGQGGQTSGAVSLVRNTVAGHSYLAGERIDDGDRVYNPAVDKLTVDSKGQPVTVQFSIQ